jgi:hypothetical protein
MQIVIIIIISRALSTQQIARLEKEAEEKENTSNKNKKPSCCQFTWSEIKHILYVTTENVYTNNDKRKERKALATTTHRLTILMIRLS